MKKVLIRLFVVFCLVASFVLVAPFSVSADTVEGFDYDNYYQLEYIQSTGTQYINTGVAPSNIFQVYMQFSKNDNASGTNSLIGFGNANTNSYRGTVFCGSTLQSWISVGGSTNTGYNTPADTKISFVYYQTASGYILNVNGNHTNVSGTTSAVNNLWLLYWTDSVNTYYGKYKLYESSVTNGSTMVRHFYPAERKSDNAYGLYDIINNQFYTNAGTGSFVAGPRVNYTQYTITTNVSPSGSGNVTGGGVYDAGAVVTLTAVPQSGYTFDHWNDGSVQNPLTITATSNITYTAYFVGSSPPQTQYTITTNVSPSGSGTVSGGGTYSSGTTITLNAYPNNGYIFSQWSDGVTSSSRQIIVNGDATYTAIFEEIPPTYYTILTNVSPSGSGTVSGGGSYLAGTSVTLSATASNGYRFSSWSDGNSDNPRTVVLTSDFNITAYFVDESIVNNIIVGYNVNIIDVDNTYVVTSFSGTAYDRLGTQQTYTLDLSSVSTYTSQNWIYQLDVILNNDYIGFATVVYNNGLFTKQVFFNGNHFTVNQQTATGNPFSTVNITFESIVLNDKYQGTPESADSVIEVTDKNDEFNEQAGDLYNYEGQFNEDLNDSLEDIQIDFDIGTQFGSKFLASANWVKSQFDTLTSNTPFGTVLSFSLVLGIALLIIGKAIK